MPRTPQDIDVRVMIPRRAAAAYQRVRSTLGGQMAAFGIEPTHANVMAAMVEILDQQLHPDRAVPCMDPNAPFYEAPDTKPRAPHPPEQREKFWRNLEQNPPPPGEQPILPGA